MSQLSDPEAFTLYNEAIRQGDNEAVRRLAARMDAEDEARRARLSAPEALTSAAMWYAGNGIPVFPLHPPGPCTEPDHRGDDEIDGKKPYKGSRGFKDATTDLEIVRGWWAATPGSNIGTPTGHMFDVIDVDGPEGYRSLADLRERGDIPTVIGKAITPRPGQHLYIQPTGDGNTSGVLPGIDYRGAGGYVVLPPSVGLNGRIYEWISPLDMTAARQAA
jgi:hypothetical protein